MSPPPKPTVLSNSLSLIAAGVLIVLSGLAGASPIGRTPASSTESPPVSAAVAPDFTGLQRVRQIADIQSELITVTPHGFEPAELTRSQGRFLLNIDNRSGLEIAALRFSAEGASRFRELNIPREEPDWSEVVDLQPGRYLLTEAHNPGWTCVVVITR